MKLKPSDLKARLNSPLPPVILIEGEETLLCIESQDQVRATAKQQGFTEREVHDAGPGFDTGVLIEARGGMSLFADKTLIELRLAKPKVDAKIEKALTFYLDGAPEDKCLLITAPKLERGEARKNWFKQASSLGWHVECTKIYANQFGSWLQSEVSNAGLRLQRDAFEMLVMRVEGNALAARQEIQKLQLFATDQAMNADEVNRICANSARYGVFDLTDACLAGNVAKVRSMLKVIEAEGSDVLGLLRLISNDIGALNKAFQHPSGLNAGLSAVGGFANKQKLLRQAGSRMNARQLVSLNQLALKVDQAAKGQSKTPAWLLLNQLALNLAGAHTPT